MFELYALLHGYSNPYSIYSMNTSIINTIHDAYRMSESISVVKSSNFNNAEHINWSVLSVIKLTEMLCRALKSKSYKVFMQL